MVSIGRKKTGSQINFFTHDQSKGDPILAAVRIGGEIEGGIMSLCNLRFFLAHPKEPNFLLASSDTRNPYFCCGEPETCHQRTILMHMNPIKQSHMRKHSKILLVRPCADLHGQGKTLAYSSFLPLSFGLGL